MDIWETYAPAGLGLGFLAALIFLLGRTATRIAHGYQNPPVRRFKHYTEELELATKTLQDDGKWKFKPHGI